MHHFGDRPDFQCHWNRMDTGCSDSHAAAADLLEPVQLKTHLVGPAGSAGIRQSPSAAADRRLRQAGLFVLRSHSDARQHAAARVQIVPAKVPVGALGTNGTDHNGGCRNQDGKYSRLTKRMANLQLPP